MTEKQPAPQWWSAPEALAWLTYGRHQAVYLVRRAIDIERDHGNPGAEYPELLDIPRGEETPWAPLPDGMQPAGGGMLEGPRELAGYCREDRLSARGRVDGAGPVEAIPLEDWEGGKTEWRDPTGGDDFRRLRLFLVVPGGRVWGGLRFRADELAECWRGTEGMTMHSYSTREEVEAAEAALWPQPESAPVAEGSADVAPSAPGTAVVVASNVGNGSPTRPGRKPGPKPKSFPKVRQYLEWRHNRECGSDLSSVTLAQLRKDVTKRLASDGATWPGSRSRRDDILKAELARLGVERD
jgi:hypothetical protein